ncbi:MAG: hypothetical protein LUB59_03715 [Candidatus Gastranaerophilales bacterium]|nr:hypothetical protein [Candidatus Gastranaerophilales bacterium]
MASNKKPLTDEERIQKLSREEKNRAAFASVKDALSLIDLTSTKSYSYTTYSKENLRTYLKNPSSESNQKSLRKLSNYLYTVSYVYRRYINFKAEQIQCKAWNVYPNISVTEPPDKETVLSNYERVCNVVKTMNMKSQIFKCMLQAWKTDVCYGYCYGDPEKNGEFFIHLLDPDYCKISSQQYYDGVFAFAFDFSFFTGTNEYYLDVYDPIFKKYYEAYQKDSSLRWQELPVENTFCIKINVDNTDYPVPPLSGMFESIIDLVDLQAIQSTKDELSIYKMIWAKIDTISGTKEVDDFEIDLDLANEFYKKVQSALPDEVTFVMSPMNLNSLSFQETDASDTNTVADAYENLTDSNGSIVMNSGKITNSTAFKMALLFDSLDAMAPVEQINSWINFYILNHVGETGMTVEYSDVSPYFVDDKIDKLLKVAQYGVPVKLDLASLAGSNPVKANGMAYLEDALGLGTTTWINPLVSSNTQGSVDGDEGRPVSDDSEISADGVATRDKGDK